MPDSAFGTRWHRVIDTADPDLLEPSGPLGAGEAICVRDRSVVVLQRSDHVEAESAATSP